MRKLLALAGMVLMGCVAHGAMINGSFSDGTTTGWTVYDNWASFPNGAQGLSGAIANPSVAVVTSHTFVGAAPPVPGTVTLLPFVGTSSFYPDYDTGGKYFAAISSGVAGQHQGLYQDVVLGEGWSVWGWAAFDRNASGNVTVYADNNLIYSAFSTDKTSWGEWSFTAPAAGTYRVSFDVLTTTAGGFGLFDMSIVPEARGWMMGGALAFVLGAVEILRRRRLKTAV